MGNNQADGSENYTVDKIQNAFNKRIKFKANFLIDLPTYLI